MDTVTTRPAVTGEISKASTAVTWSAIFAGALGAAAVSIVLILLGSSIGLTSMSPWPGLGMSVAAIGVSSAVWLIITQWLAAAFGGYLAGRLRTRWIGVHTHEVFFRDTAHGFLAWALATVFAVALVSLAAASVASKAVDAGATVASGAAAGAAVGTTPDGRDANAYFVDTLFRSGQTSPTASPGQSRAETSRILVRSVADGEISPADKTYLTQLVARETGVTEPEASQRVDNAVAQAKAAEAKVREAADQARKVAARLSLFTVLSLVIGAFIASTAAAIGGGQRDDHEVAAGLAA